MCSACAHAVQHSAETESALCPATAKGRHGVCMVQGLHPCQSDSSGSEQSIVPRNARRASRRLLVVLNLLLERADSRGKDIARHLATDLNRRFCVTVTGRQGHLDGADADARRGRRRVRAAGPRQD